MLNSKVKRKHQTHAINIHRTSPESANSFENNNTLLFCLTLLMPQNYIHIISKMPTICVVPM